MTLAKPPVPPADVPPERLFRRLLPLRPTLPLAYRLRLAPDVPLLVRAPTGAEEGAALDRGAEALPEIRVSATQLEVLALCLYTPTGRAFGSADEAGMLPESEAAVLVEHVAAALDQIAPSYARSDTKAWSAALELGARHYTNLSTALTLAAAVDNGAGGGRNYRPDRYWGCPLSDLLDGHWMIYSAAIRAAEALRKT